MSPPAFTRRRLFAFAGGTSIAPTLNLARADVQSPPPGHADLGAALQPQTPAERAAAAPIVNYDFAAGNILRYGTNSAPGTTDMSDAFQAAFDQQVQGGAAIYVPAGTYFITKVISTSTAAPFALSGDGMGKTIIVKGTDTDCFVISNSGDAHNQITISDLTISPGIPMNEGSALNISCKQIIPSVTLRNVMILCSGANVFRCGIRLRDCAEVEMSRVFIYGVSSDSMTGVFVTQSAASTTYKFIGCSMYKLACGFAFADTTRPGIEGIQFYGCDLVAVQCGVSYTNSFGPGYFPPQLTWVGGHINASVRSFDLSIMCQVIIEGLLSYNSGSHQHIKLWNVSDINIHGNTFVQTGGTADGIAMAAGSVVNGGIVAGNVFRLGANGSAINLNAANIKNLSISDNQRVSGSNTVYVSGGILDGSVLISSNTPRDEVDIYDGTLIGASRMSLAGIRSDYCRIAAPSRTTVCTALTSRRSWDRVILECSSELLILQHNAIKPDGFCLSGGVDYKFPSTGGRITLEKREGGYWSEVARVG